MVLSWPYIDSSVDITPEFESSWNVDGFRKADGKDIFVTPEVAPRVRKARELSSGSR